MKRYESEFKKNLAGIDFNTLENSPNVIFGISEKLELQYFNNAWIKFSNENKGEPGISDNFPIGSLIIDGIYGNLKDYYSQKYKEVISKKKVWDHAYECSSPSTFRIFHQITYPVKNTGSLIILNSIEIERKRVQENNNEGKFMEDDYLQKSGFITQCSNCRRTQRANISTIWDWIPIWVEKLHEKTRFSICPVCYDYYWKEKL